MSVSPLPPISNFESYIIGEVKIDPSAAIATGVVLQAEPNSRIIIAAGVCLGVGVILHARDGTLEIDAEATLGARVLVVGKGKIGANACIGSATTILNPAIAPRQVVAPDSLIGDSSRSTTELSAANKATPSPSQEAALVATSELSAANKATPSPSQEAALVATSQQEGQEVAISQSVLEPPQKPDSKVVYGKDSLTRLMATLFPHRQALNQPLQDNSSQPDST